MASRKRADYTPKHEWVDPEPFSRLINELWVKHEEEPSPPNAPGPSQWICELFGWDATEANSKRVYRFRHQLTETKINGKRTMVKATRIKRATVEDACHHAGVDFYELYPDLEHERSGDPAPEGWCPACQEHVLVVDECCVWCSWKVSPGHMRPSAPVLPLEAGEMAFDRALQLRAAGLSYSSIIQVMGIYHGLWRKQDYWRKGLRARGVEATPRGTGFQSKAKAA